MPDENAQAKPVVAAKPVQVDQAAAQQAERQRQQAADPVMQAKAERDARIRQAADDAQQRQRDLDAKAEAGRMEREHDLRADEEAERARMAREKAEYEQAAREAAAEANRQDDALQKALAERERRIDMQDAQAAERRRHRLTDHSLGAQVVLPQDSQAARAARGGAADTVEENTMARDTDLAAQGIDPAQNDPDSREERAQKAADTGA